MNCFRIKGWQERWLLTVLLAVAGHVHLCAQLSEQVYRSASRIDPLRKGNLYVTVDNLNFFRNNEWATVMTPGYTLPGFWLQPKITYYPTKNIKIEAGVHSLWFRGTNRYPSYAYSQLPQWEGEASSAAVHVMPYLRAQVAFSGRVQLVLGNIYGGANHRLIEPLYNPELNLTADPESGLQLLYNAPRMDLDMWVDWTEFIYRSDVKQEAFNFGLSVRMNVNRPESLFHVYFPLQALAQHQGGQIDATDLPVFTAVNGAAGAGLDWNLRRGLLGQISLEWNATGYYQHAGDRWPLKGGHGIYTALSAGIADFRIKSAYWRCDRFISLLGNSLFGAPSLSVEDAYFERPEMVTLGLSYSRSFEAGYALGIDFDLYQRFAAQLHDPASGVSRVGAKSNYSFGIYFRVNPSFLIKSNK
ncbi:MAG: hypothetical protein LBK22_02285 [Tannerella sp.]|jgi:hypothetical protein|nr:hypothetical protein [Tannerella sp.]